MFLDAGARFGLQYELNRDFYTRIFPMSRVLRPCGLTSLVALMALVVSGVRAAPVELAVPAGELASLVKQLGDEEFVVRETAAEKLTKIGLSAREALEEGSKDS